MQPERPNVCEEPVKLFIKDIFRLERDEDDRYSFSGKLVRKVDIMGIVTEVKRVNDSILYRVDDCTGEIVCRFNHQCENNLRETNEIELLQTLVGNNKHHYPSEVGAAQKAILQELCTIKKSMASFEQGDCVHIQGFIHDFHGTHEVTAFTANKVSSIAEEVDRVFELSLLYSTVYSQH